MLTRDEAIGLGLKLGSQRIGIDLSEVVPELVHSIYSDFDKEIDSLQKRVDELKILSTIKEQGMNQVIIIDKQILMDAIMGREPSYKQMEHPLCKIAGDYSGGFSESWTWNEYELVKLTEEQLFNLYAYLRSKG